MGDSQFSFKDGNGFPVFIDCFGIGTVFKIEISGKFIHFSWSDRFGPLPETKTGHELALGPNHKFWRAASLWNLQGQRVCEDGRTCLWHEPKKPVLKHLGGKHYQVIEEGEPGHDW